MSYRSSQTHHAQGGNSGAHSQAGAPGRGDVAPAGGQGYDLPSVTTKQEDAHFLITGVPGVVHNRLEIHDFVKNEKFFSLYIQALDMIYKYSHDNVQSFFQIGAIHGRPYEAWDGATASDDEGVYQGYCTHGTVLFPTWHRPYVLLLEQVLQKHAADIANTYTVDSASWKQAAAALRQPYWDWAAHATPPPEVISYQHVTITGSNGARIQVENPLYKFIFPPGETSSFEGNFQIWPTTLRRPTSANGQAESNVPELIAILEGALGGVQGNTYALLTQVFDWDTFSKAQGPPTPGAPPSVEGIHNGIHGRVGSSTSGFRGHMGDNSMAAFDPIFYLHHTNVDRLLSIWSSLNPGVWVTPGDSADGTVTIPEGSTVDTNTPLSPYWKTNTSFWTSAEVTNTESLGYSYPDFNGIDKRNAQTIKAAVGAKVNLLYSGSGILGSIPNTPTTPAPPTAPVPSSKCPNHGKWQWTARIRVKKFEVGGSFQVVLFLGTVPTDPKQWELSPTSVGTYCILANEDAGNCANCRSQSAFVEQGSIPLNRGICRISGLHSLDPAGVVEYLKENLHWRAQRVDGTPANPPSLEVTIFCTPLTYPSGAIFPVAGSPIHYTECTRGRAGGCR